MTIPHAGPFAATRTAFLAAAEEAGATLDRHDHPLAGPDGEALGTDVARCGAPPGDARAVVIMASGTHGVEGHAGGGLQRLALADGRVAALSSDVAAVFVHAVNPYGLAWDRRVDHDNIDVNRNFVDFGAELPGNPLYADIDAMLNPGGTDLDLDDTGWIEELMAFAERVGPSASYQAITGGQYEHPHGLQFGGTAPSWSRRTLESIWGHHLRDADVVVHLDVHTGLGPKGVLTLFQTADADETAAEVGRRWFPDVLRSDRDDPSLQLNRGVLGPGLDEAVGDRTLSVPIVVEFGSEDEATVLGAMRADNWLHHHGDPQSEAGRAIRDRTRRAFFVDDPDWRASVAHDGMAAMHAALDAVDDPAVRR